MAMDLHGILNQNEYYTNHYFTTIFEENAADTISKWKQESKESEKVTPWAAFRDTSKNYYRIRERYLQLRNEERSMELIENQAVEYLNALGFSNPISENIQLSDNLVVPVFHEEKKSNGAPLLWVILSVSEERGDDILLGKAFGKKNVDDEEYSVHLHENNDESLATLFFAGEEAPRWIILIGINQIALIDRNKWDRKKYLQFDLDEIFSRHEETTFQALTVLLHKTSLCPTEGNSLLDSLDENSYKHSSGVSDSLKYALRECIELLGNEVLHDMRTRQNINLDENPVDAGELTVECLRYMYRILFMLFIESREELGFAPMKSDVYQKGYSLEGVRDVCENVRDLSAEAAEGYYIDETISALFDMIYTGYPENPTAYKEALKIEALHHMFTIEPLKAHIFDPQYTQLINNAKLRNVTMLKIVDLMSISRPSSAKERKGRISYSALGINQMGAVYEALLSYRGFIASEDLYEVKRAGDKFNELDVGYFVPERELDKYTEDERVRYEDHARKGKLRMYEKGSFIYRLAGREREKSASYYTPEVLTKCLVKYALKELLQDKTADEILNLTVCEPAMGSAAFLNEAINQLAEAYLDKKQEELGEQIPFDSRAMELQRVKMFIADRNVYGVDLNPIAVELAEVSLWLNTIYKGAHVPWFGTQLACGNSLIGARRQVYNAAKLKRGTWYEEEPEKVPEEYETQRLGEIKKIYKRKRAGASYIYHFLLGDPGMANYTDKVIKELEPDNIKKIKQWQKEFCSKYSDDDIEILNRLSELVDKLWMRTIEARQRVEIDTEDTLSVYGHDEGKQDEHLTIREKDTIYKNIYKSEGGDNASPYARLKAVMDYWCALWFWPIEKADLLPTRQEFFMDLSLILEGWFNPSTSKSVSSGQIEMIIDENKIISGLGTYGSKLANEVITQIQDLGEVNLNELRKLYPRLRIADDIAKQQKFMHWELEFANLFYERGGFDLVIGNPPWIKLVWNEQSVLADLAPIISIRKLSATQVANQRDALLMNPSIIGEYMTEYESVTGMQNFFNSSQNYNILSGCDTNLYKCFMPQAVGFANQGGVFAYVHPNTIFDETKGGALRAMLYPKLRRSFRFQNELKLFPEVGHAKTFCLSVFRNGVYDSFDWIVNLFAASTVDECYSTENDVVSLGIKNEKGEWNTEGHPDRVIKVTSRELKTFSKVFDDSTDYKSAKLPVVQTEELVGLLNLFAECEDTVGSDGSFFATTCWSETGAQEDGTIERNVHFAESLEDVIVSGPHIGVANPVYQTAQENCDTHGAFDAVDTVGLNENYLPRYNYRPIDNWIEYYNKAPSLPNGDNYLDHYRILSRRRINKSQERTLMSALYPPKVGHVNTVIGVTTNDAYKLAVLLGEMVSVPCDALIKILGKDDLYYDSISKLPLLNCVLCDEIVARALLLNCLTRYYSSIWSKLKSNELASLKWAKNDSRLNINAFQLLGEDWCGKSPLKLPYERRQAMVELDVLIAMGIGMSLELLLSVYNIQFPVLKKYESDTWYDQTGRIVFTNNRSMTGVGLSRKEWEDVKNQKEGCVTQVVIDDTMPGGPLERTITYVAPFDRCNRESDYAIAWKYFEKKYGECI